MKEGANPDPLAPEKADSIDQMQLQRASMLEVRLTKTSMKLESRMAYLDMNYTTYLVVSLMFYILIVVLAMVLKDIGVIFHFISASAISCIAFFIPGFWYKKAVIVFGVDATQPEVAQNLRICLILNIMGVINTVLGFASGFISMT